MADRVAIIGGSTVGRDHFPWPVEDKPVLLVQYFPLSLSLSDAAKWVWLVKKWRLTGTLTFDVTFGPDIFSCTVTYDLILNGYTTNIDIPIVTREAEIVIMYGVAVFDGTADIDFDGEFVEFFSNGMGILDSGYPALAFGDGALWPMIDFVGQIDGNTTLADSDSAFMIRFTCRNPDEDAIETSSTITDGMTLDGNAIDLYYQIATDVGTATISNVDGNLLLDPDEYWPYATKAGLPVYDTSTGAQIADPFS